MIVPPIVIVNTNLKVINPVFIDESEGIPKNNKIYQEFVSECGDSLQRKPWLTLLDQQANE